MKNVTLGKDVLDRDGEKVGEIDRIIVHPETLEVDGFVVHEGVIFTHDRIVDESFVERIDAEGNVILNISAEDEERLPELATRRVSEPRDGFLERIAEMNYMLTPSAAGQVLVASGPVDASYAPAPDSPLRPAAATAPIIRDETNLPDNTVVLEEGTDVFDRNGDKIGTISEVIYDSVSRLEAIVVSEGLIFKHDVRVPASWIKSMTHDAVTLMRTSDEAEMAGKID